MQGQRDLLAKEKESHAEFETEGDASVVYPNDDCEIGLDGEDSKECKNSEVHKNEEAKVSLPPEESINELMEMGFDRHLAIIGLEQNNNDVATAMGWLCSDAALEYC